VRIGVDVRGERLDRLPDRHVDQDVGAPGLVSSERLHGGRVAVLGLQPPDEPGGRVRCRVHRVKGGHEVCEQRAVQRLSIRPMFTCTSR
jgi:hypothetical protein